MNRYRYTFSILSALDTLTQQLLLLHFAPCCLLCRLACYPITIDLSRVWGCQTYPLSCQPFIKALCNRKSDQTRSAISALFFSSERFLCVALHTTARVRDVLNVL